MYNRLTQIDRVPISTCPDDTNLRMLFVDHSIIMQYYTFVRIGIKMYTMLKCLLFYFLSVRLTDQP